MNTKPLASRLEGKKVGQWTVIKRRMKTADDHSGYFSACYEVENEKGQKAFLKAYNYLYAFGRSAGSADVLKFMTENFTYERDLLALCSGQKMRRVVVAIDSGEYREQGEVISVPYLTFEIADGNLKSYLPKAALGWKLQSFHDALLGVNQLHMAKIAHQDIKPSNILIFGNKVSKISDLGSATQFGKKSNWETAEPPGDLRYAPIELLYHHFSPHWETRRLGADLFMMGGLLTYMIADANFLSLMYQHLQDNQRHDTFGGTFQDAMPFLLNAYHLALGQLKPSIPEPIRNELAEIIAELSHPDPDKRGTPPRLLNKHNRFSLERYISITDRLSKKIK
jgi:eukaryotic-like serine/threonine-protein kinase